MSSRLLVDPTFFFSMKAGEAVTSDDVERHPEWENPRRQERSRRGGGGRMGIAVPQSIGSSINCLGTESTEADRRSRKATKTV